MGILPQYCHQGIYDKTVFLSDYFAHRPNWIHSELLIIFLKIWQCTWAVVLPCPNWIAKYVCKFEKLQKKSWMTICTKIVLEKKSKSWTAVQISNLPNRFSEQQCTICLSGTAFAKKCPYRKLGRICLKQKFAQKMIVPTYFKKLQVWKWTLFHNEVFPNCLWKMSGENSHWNEENTIRMIQKC